MKKIIATSLVAFALGLSVRTFATDFAGAVVDYTSGTLLNSDYDTGNPYNNPNAVLGQPGGIVGAGTAYTGVFSPFNPHYQATELTGIGHGGQLTLQLQNFVTVSSGAFEIGVWSNVGLTDTNYPYGTASAPASTFSTPVSAVVSVSSNGTDWVALNSGAPTTFGLPGNYYTNATTPFDAAAPASPQLADFGKPFTGTLADFNGETWSQVLATLNGSAGGTWLNLDSTGLSQVGFIRFSGVADGSELDLNAVSINSTLSGASVPEPGSTGLLLLGGILVFGFWHRK